jgi:hypothetical protein
VGAATAAVLITAICLCNVELKLKNQCNKFLANFGVSDVRAGPARRDEV